MDIVHIDISSDLSSTYQNACLAASELEEGRIHVVDSRHLSTGGGLLALQGAKLRDAGEDAAAIAAALREMAECGDTSFVLDTLQYMWKGGRCSGVTALGANLLKLKPCLQMQEGQARRRQEIPRPDRQGLPPVRRRAVRGQGRPAGACVHHALRRRGAGDARRARAAGSAGRSGLRGVHHAGGLHRLVALRPRHAWCAVPAPGRNRPKNGQKGRWKA